MSEPTLNQTEERPSIFHPTNKLFWEIVRRGMIAVLKELDKWYGWRTFDA